MMLGFSSSQDSFWRFVYSSCMLLNKWATTIRAETAEIISDGKLYPIETNDDQDFTNIQWPFQELTDCRYPAYVSPTCQGDVRGISEYRHKMWPNIWYKRTSIYWILKFSVWNASWTSQLNMAEKLLLTGLYEPNWGLVAYVTSNKHQETSINIHKHL